MSSTDNEDTDDLSERIAVMLRQECTIYQCEDYLSPDFQRKQVQLEKSNRSSGNSCCLFASTRSTWSSASSNSSTGVNELWREKICEWSYQVIDHFDFNREIVCVSLSYLDRFLSTQPVNRKIFQLAAMTTLYLAIKLYEPNSLKMSSLLELSRGYFMVEHIAAMEQAILRALAWRVHPPTPLTMVRHLLQLWPNNSSTPKEVNYNVLEMARFLTELSVCDYFFVTRKPSSIGVAALLISLDSIVKSQLIASDKTTLLGAICAVDGIDYDSDEVKECKLRLSELFSQGGDYQQEPEIADLFKTPKSTSLRRESPVSITALQSADFSEEGHQDQNIVQAEHCYSKSDHALNVIVEEETCIVLRRGVCSSEPCLYQTSDTSNPAALPIREHHYVDVSGQLDTNQKPSKAPRRC